VAASFLTPLLKTPDTPWVLRNVRHGGLVARHLETAFDSRQRNRGLLGRDALADSHALILAPCSSIHTWFMRFAIDVAFVDRAGRIVRARAAVAPWRMQVSLRAFAVVELASGALQETDTRAEDRLYLAAE
jgi:uncharacterized membrane protein (UPF0127 family)